MSQLYWHGGEALHWQLALGLLNGMTHSIKTNALKKKLFMSFLHPDNQKWIKAAPSPAIVPKTTGASAQ